MYISLRPRCFERVVNSRASDHVQVMDKIMETVVKDTHFFINMELGHHLSVTQLVSFLEETE
jgi:hypothetical protein